MVEQTQREEDFDVIQREESKSEDLVLGFMFLYDIPKICQVSIMQEYTPSAQNHSDHITKSCSNWLVLVFSIQSQTANRGLWHGQTHYAVIFKAKAKCPYILISLYSPLSMTIPIIYFRSLFIMIRAPDKRNMGPVLLFFFYT